jgi:hypothetical protein
MNTLPQTFDARPLHRSAGARPGTRGYRHRASAPLKLVVGRVDATVAVDTQPAAAPRPVPSYGLQGRRHLAGVPQLQSQAEVTSLGADRPGMATPWSPRRLEPLAFALVLLASVAALAATLRAG